MTPEPAGRALAVDLGSRRVGVAVSDGARTLALPRPAIERSGHHDEDHRRIAALAEEASVSVVVVGLPLSLDGRRGPAARAAEAEAAELRRLLDAQGVEVVTYDERLTTVSAHAALAVAGKDSRRRRSVVDSASAAVLLQAWMDRR